MEPLTPPDCDLRDFPTMPLDGGRLFGSEFHGISSDSAWRAGVTLWLKSWHQVPAASLPDDDVQLARLAEFAKDVRGWRKVRDHALRGWVKCDDGRLYHPVVAEKANHAWARKESYRERSRKGNEARYGRSKETEDGSLTPPLGRPEGLQLRLLKPPKGEGEGEGEEPRETSSLGNARGARLPDDFRLPGEWRDWAKSEGWADVDIDDQAARFADHWHAQPGKDGRKTDWLATWRNWMRRAPEFGRRTAQNGYPAGHSGIPL